LGHVVHMLTFASLAGVRPPCDGDGNVHGPDRSSPVHLETQALHFRIGEPYNRETAIWNEGKKSQIEKQRAWISDHCVDYFHLHPDSVR
jgi:hypothetical protein